MPHVITGQIRKAPFTMEGSNNNGRWKMYAVELSERMKIRNQNGEDETVYSNYRATFFAKENVMQWYDESFQEGKVVSIYSDTLHLSSRQGNDGTVYVTAEMIRPQLQFSQREPAQQHSQGQKRQQPQQQQRQQQQPNQSMQFDDDIPF
uniref:Single-stranded DNA binding protein n=1 Tax=Escherichia phage ETEP102 TaxID=3117680 RepID=A0AAU6PXJ8_9CAUD